MLVQNKPIFNDSIGLYNYCPSVFQENNKRYIYYCVNLIPYKIIDYIGYREGKMEDNTWEYGDKIYVLEPTSNNDQAWDHIHTCDPSIIKGLFNYKGQEFGYCMAFLGCNTLDCTINEIGIAFSKKPYGPWVKYDRNPIIGFDSKTEGIYWGVGQPSIVSLDKKGKFRLFYTRNDQNGSYSCYVDCNLINADNPIMSIPLRIPEVGMTNKEGKQDILTNGDYLYDPIGKGYYVIRDRWVRDGKFPSIITSELQLTYAEQSIFDVNSNTSWQVLGNITPSETGAFRNHNAGLVRDPYGWMLDSYQIEVVYTNSIESESNEDLIYLWNYRLHHFVFTV